MHTYNQRQSSVLKWTGPLFQNRDDLFQDQGSCLDKKAPTLHLRPCLQLKVLRCEYESLVQLPDPESSLPKFSATRSGVIMIGRVVER